MTNSQIAAIANERDAAVRVAAKQEIEISALQSKLRICGNEKRRFAQNWEAARVLQEQAEYEGKKWRRSYESASKRADDNERRLAYLRTAAKDQCEYAGIE